MPGLNHLTPFTDIPACDNTYDPSTRQYTPCPELRIKIISLRVYFTIILLHCIFIVITTSYFVHRILSANKSIPIDLAFDTNNSTISQRWQLHSLRKRSLFGSVLGALGYFVFSTAVLSYQAFADTFSCDIYLFGSILGFFIWVYAIIWRSQRLHLLIRMSELQKQYHAENKGVSVTMKNASNLKKIEEKDYIVFMRNNKKKLCKSTAYHVLIFFSCILVIIIIIVLSETLGIWKNGISSCQFYMGTYVCLSMDGFFFFVIGPLIVWYLRNDDDAHGMRRELWITMIVGAPCIVMTIIWLTAFPYYSDTHPLGARGLFSPSNWILLMTTTNYVVTMILPVVQTLSVDDSSSKKRSVADSLPASRRDVRDNRHIVYFKKGHHRAVSATSSQTASDFRWELNTESLEQALCDPNKLKILKDWAVKDFSVENVLFYDHYVYLVQQLDRAIGLTRQQQPEGSQSQLGVSSATQSPDHQQHGKDAIQTITTTTPPPRRESIMSEATTLPKLRDEILQIPFPSDLIPELVDFYTTFIADQAPLQVNISHKARLDLDALLKPLAVTSTNNLNIFVKPEKPNDTHQYPKGTTFKLFTSTNAYRPPHAEIIMEEDITPVYPNSNNSTYKDNDETKNNLTLEIFEDARQEVFWNIFSGIFAKVVEAHNFNLDSNNNNNSNKR